MARTSGGVVLIGEEPQKTALKEKTQQEPDPFFSFLWSFAATPVLG
jgi:hypothetical protein